MPRAATESIGAESRKRLNDLGIQFLFYTVECRQVELPAKRNKAVCRSRSIDDNRLNELETLLGYRFDNRQHLRQALTHSSASPKSYQTMEFLGDAVLNLAVSDLLYAQGDSADEGDLTGRRSAVVNNRHALCAVSSKFNLIDYAVMGNSFQMSNSSALRRLRADLIEAVIGAIYLDAGYDKALKFVSIHFSELIEGVRHGKIKDSKSALQELAQRKGEDLPVYRVVEIAGDDHEPMFTIDCEFAGLSRQARGKGRSIKEAEQMAAAIAYESIRDEQ